MPWSLAGTAGAVAAGTTPMTVTAGQSSAAGSLLICRLIIRNSVVAPTLPAGWVLRVSGTNATAPIAGAHIFEYTASPGGISTVAVSFGGGGTAHGMITEYTCPQVQQAAADQTGTGSGAVAASSGTLSLATAGNLAGSHELAVAVFAVQYSAATTLTLSPAGSFAETGQFSNGSSANGHGAFDDWLDTGLAGAVVSDNEVNTWSAGSATGVWAGALATYLLPPITPLYGLPQAVQTAATR